MRWLWIAIGGFLMGIFTARLMGRGAARLRQSLWERVSRHVENYNRKAEELIETGAMYEGMGMTDDAVACYEESRRWSDRTRALLDEFARGTER